MFLISDSVYALSVMYTKSDMAGAYTSSIFETRNMAATPTSCNLDLCTFFPSMLRYLEVEKMNYKSTNTQIIPVNGVNSKE